jgi:hypothetical protein
MEAVPLLLRRWFPLLGAPECYPAANPIRCGELPKLRRAGQLERFIELACRRGDGDSVLLLVDADDDCPKDVISELSARAAPIAARFRKKVGMCLVYREYETLFLFGLQELVNTFDAATWVIEDGDLHRDWEKNRGAKGVLKTKMKGYYYKETRDQARLTHALDIARVRERCRSAIHIDRALQWLLDATDRGWCYPAP